MQYSDSEEMCRMLQRVSLAGVRITNEEILAAQTRRAKLRAILMSRNR